MPNIGPMEVALVLIVALLILGPKRLPSTGRSLGEGIRGFKRSLAGHTDEDRPERHPDDNVAAISTSEAVVREDGQPMGERV